MPDLLDIQEKLAVTNAAISRLLQSLATDPNDSIAQVNMRSLQRKQRNLEKEFLQRTDYLMIDVCSYRIIPEATHGVNLNTLSVLTSFQKWVSLVFHAITSKEPLRKKIIPASVADKTALAFAYAFPGSAGFVFTVPADRFLIGPSDIDQAVATVLSMAKETSSTGILNTRIGSALRRYG